MALDDGAALEQTLTCCASDSRAIEAIADTLKCELLEGTGEEVLSTLLDEQGRYRRVATGWGDLS